MRKIIFFLFICAYATSFAQYTHNFEYPTPQATAPSIGSLMKQVDYPVSLYTGLVNIEIPLYEIIEGDIRLPISLQYHASGIKVFDFDGQFGAGWSLSSDFSISRRVEGLPDDIGSGYFSAFSGDRYSWLNLLNGRADGSPDIYYYKLLDKSGKFYFSKNTFEAWQGQIVTNPYEPIRIEAIRNSSIDAFQITNDDGTRYDFSERRGDSWHLHQIASPNGKHSISFTYNKDYLSYELVQQLDYIGVDEMVRRQYPQPLFPHQGSDYSYPYVTLFQKDSYSIISHEDPRIIDRNPTLEEISAGPIPFPVSPNGPVRSVSTINSINTIEASYVKVEFVGTKTISSIIVTNKLSGDTLRRINLYYSNNRTTTLDKVEIIGAGGQREVYQMTYNGTRLYNTNKGTNMGLDHWGYYNGYDIPGGNRNTTLIPMSVLKTREYLARAYANPILQGRAKAVSDEWVFDPVKILIKNLPYRTSERKAVPECMQHAMLTSITYPTGRKSSFFYEAHQYLHKYSEEKRYNFGYGHDEWAQDDYDDGETILPDEVKYAGGLRIKKIEEYDPVTGTTLTKEYKYGKKEDGVGYIKHQVDIEDYGYELYKIGTMVLNMPDPVKIPFITKMRMYTKFSVPNLFFGNGSTTVYDYVTEYTVNNVTGEKQKSIYHYDAEKKSDAYRVGYTKMLFDPLTDWKYGQLLDKTDYEYSDGKYHKAMYRKNEYEIFGYQGTPDIRIWRNIIWDSDYTSPNPYEDVDNAELDYPYTKHEIGSIESGRKYLSREVTTTYTDSGDSVSTEVKYNYWNYILRDKPYTASVPLLTQKETLAGRGIWSIEKYKYPFTSSFNLVDEENARLKLIENNQIYTLLEKELLKRNAHTIQRNGYLISPESGLPLPASITTTTGLNNTDEERVKILKYDVYGNPVYIQKDGNNAVYLWSYGGQYLVAEILAATYEEVEQSLSSIGISSIQSLSENKTPDKSTLDKLRNSAYLKKSAVTTYEYKPTVGMVSMTNPQGITVYYEYDSFGRLNAVRDHDKNIVNSYHYNYQNQ